MIKDFPDGARPIDQENAPLTRSSDFAAYEAKEFVVTRLNYDDGTPPSYVLTFIDHPAAHSTEKDANGFGPVIIERRMRSSITLGADMALSIAKYFIRTEAQHAATDEQRST